MKYPNILRAFLFSLAGILAASSAFAEQREWTSSDNKVKIKAELVNAYGDTAFFMKEDGAFFHTPTALYTHSDVARILEWARERDAQPTPQLVASQAKLSKDICTQWPQVITHGVLSDAKIGDFKEPKFYVLFMIQGDSPEVFDFADNLSTLQAGWSAEDAQTVRVIALCPFSDDDLKPLVSKLGKFGEGWLMPNAWVYKKDLWKDYYRKGSYNVLILDPQGNILCDSAAKEHDGKPSDPIAFLTKMIPFAKAVQNGGFSVTNPYVNEKAIQAFFNKESSAKTASLRPQPLMFDFSGVDAATFQSMEGHDYQVSIEIGTDGYVRNLSLKAGGDATIEAALRQASTLWRFLPAMKEGVPQVKTVIIPIRIKAPAPAQPAAK